MDLTPSTPPADHAPGSRARTPGERGARPRRRRASAEGQRQAQALAVPDAPSCAPEAPMLDVAGARQEILHTPAAAIHRGSAYRWASRAVAGYRICAEGDAVDAGLAYLYLGEHYREAALAHAAMGEAWQPLYSEIDQAMSADRAKAFMAMRRRAAASGR